MPLEFQTAAHTYYYQSYIIVPSLMTEYGSGKYLQLYLGEFCCKLDRRYFGDKLFDKLTLAVAKSYWQVCGKAF